MFSSLASGAKALGLRFSLTGLLPFSLLVVYFFGLYSVANVPADEGVIEAVGTSARQVGLTGLVLLLMTAIVLAVISEPFQIGVVRLLEGYWGATVVGDRARNIGVELQRRRLHLLGLRYDRLDQQPDRKESAGYLRQRLHRYPKHGRLLPTLLGNTLRAGEESAGGRYDLNTSLSWPRLYYCLPDTITRNVAQLHQQIDGGARLTLVLAIAGVASVPVLLPYGWWNAVSLSLLALAFVAYRGAISAAGLLRSLIETAYDLHRFDLLTALHLTLPNTPIDEKITNKVLTRFWRGEGLNPVPDGVSYAHPMTDDMARREKREGQAPEGVTTTNP
jgi:hypothetical protein